MLTAAIALLIAPGGLRGQESAPPPAAADLEEDLLGGFDDPAAEDDDLLGGFDDEPSQDDLLEGFDEAPGGQTRLAAETGPGPQEPPWWVISGSASFGGAFNYQQEVPTPQRGLSRLRPVLRLDLEMDLGAGWDAQVSGIAFYDFAYSIKGRDRFTGQVLDQYEDEVEFRELYVRGSPTRSLDLQVGRQIVVWGFADFVRVVDVLNPVENREPGLADVEDLRLPIGMTRLAYFAGDWSLTGIAVHEITFNKDPVIGSDFYPLPQQSPFGAGRWPPKEEVLSHGGANTEYGTELKGIFSGWDLAFYWAQYFDDSAHLEIEFTPEGIPDPRLRHSRLTLLGTSADVALGNWLFKGDAAHISGFAFNNVSGNKVRQDVLAGVEYSGITDVTLALEVVNRHYPDFESAMADFPDGASMEVIQYALVYFQDFMNQTVTVQGILLAFGKAADEGNFQRYSVEYDVFDDFTVTAGVLIVQSAGNTNPLFQAARLNDRVFFDSKLSF